MIVASSLEPWPWPSRFSKVVHTLVRMPPEVGVLLFGFSEWREWGGEHTFPWSDVFFEDHGDRVDWMEVEVLSDLGILEGLDVLFLNWR